jgi:hypothetical protein
MMSDDLQQQGWRWILVLAALGLLTSTVFARLLHLDRALFVAVWALFAGVAWWRYSLLARVSIRTQLKRRWLGGVIVGLLIGWILIQTVVRQPASEVTQGTELLVQLVWVGVVYGMVDALMLSILPVLLLYASRPASDLASPFSRLRWAGAALAGSALVTAAYHAGFREFQNPSLIGPLIGNLAVTLGYLLSGSPVAPIVSHVLMHLAAVLHGAATTVQLPPHY